MRDPEAAAGLAGCRRKGLLAFVALWIAPAASYAAPVVLTGNYLQVGISDHGTFGSNGSTEPGILHDPSGTRNFSPDGIPNDYLTPGNPHDAFAINSTQTGLLTSDNNGSGSIATASPTLLTGAAARGYRNAATWSSTYGDAFSVTNSYFYNDGDERVRIVSVVTALTDLTNVAFARSTDPDPDYNRYASYDTVNTRGDSATGPTDLVSAAGQVTGLTLGILNQSGTTYVHNTAITSACCTTPDPYTTLTTVGGVTYPDTSIGDYGLQMAWSLGTLLTGQSAEIDYAYVFGTSQDTVSSGSTINTIDGDLDRPARTDVFSLSSRAANENPVTFEGGTLRMVGGSFPGNVIGVPVTITNSNGTVDTGPADGGFSGPVSGPGSLTIIGSHTFSLTGDNSYGGGTVLQGGTLLVGSDTALGTGALSMADGTTLREDVGVTLGNAVGLTGTATIQTGPGDTQGLVLNGTVSGTGTLNKTGASGLRLAGDNTYSGGTTLTAGFVGITRNTSLGTGTLTFAGGFLQAQADGLTVSNPASLRSGGLIDTQGNGLTYAGAISGEGQLSKTGTGTLFLTGTNSYSGGTLLLAGTTAVDNPSAIGTGALTFGTSSSGRNGTFQANAPGLTFGNDVVLSSSGTVDTQGYALTLSGVISGNGTLTKTGTGTLSPTNSNTYGGGTVIQGGTVEVSTTYVGPQSTADLQAARSQPGALQGTPDSVGLQSRNGDIASSVGTGPVTLDGGTLRFTGGAYSLANPFLIGPGGGTIDSNGHNQVSLNGGFYDAAGGTGTLVFANTGAGRTAGVDYDFLLFRTSTFTGSTVVAGNTYVLSDSDNAIGTGSLQVDAGGTLDLGAFNQAVTRLSGSGSVIASGYSDLGLVGTLTVQSGAFAGTLADGTNTDTATNTTSRGSLALTKVSDGSASGGTLVLSGTSSYSGPTAVNGGTLQAGSAAALSPNSAFTVAGGATLDVAGFTSTIGSLAGAGTVTNTGAAVATLTAGGTGASTTFSGVLADGTGALALAKAGAGTLTLSGANSFSGGTFLRGGSIGIGSSTAFGSGTVFLDDGTTLRAVADGLDVGNTLVFTGIADPTVDTGPNTLTLSGNITGAGALTKLGSGTLILTGQDSYTGATDVAAGTLQVDGAVTASPITIDNGAALAGSGSAQSFTASSGATVAPGSTGRSLTVTGDATFLAGSTYQVAVNPDGTNTRLTVGGTASLGGSRLAVLAASGTYAAQSYTILTAARGVSGTFGTVSTPGNLALLRPSVRYEPTDVVLTLSPVDFATVAGTPNQAQVARAIQALGPGNPLYDAVLQQNQAGARQAFNAASGVTYATAQQAARTNTRFTTGLVIDRLWDVSGNGLSAQQVLDSFAPDRTPLLVRCYAPAQPVPPPPPPSFTAWGEGFGVFGHTDATANSGSSDRSLGGFVLGIDTPLQQVLEGWRGGVAVGYTNTTFTSSLDDGRGTVQGVYGSLYGGARYGSVDVRVGTTVGGTFVDAKRTVAFPGFGEIEKANNAGATVQTFGEVGYRIPVGPGIVEPVAGAAYLHAHQGAFDEQGGAAALHSNALDTDLGITTLGFRGQVQPIPGVPMIAHVFLGWQHSFGDLSPATTLAFEAAPANTFSVTAVPLDRDAVAGELALDYRATPALVLGASYAGLAGARAADHAVKGRVEYRF